MIERDDTFARRAIARLDAGLDALDAATLARLANARAAALDRLDQRTGRRPRVAWPAALGGFNARYALGAVLVCIALFALTQFDEGTSRIDEIAEIDARILAGDLPIDAYLDRQLDPWLAPSQR